MALVLKDVTSEWGTDGTTYTTISQQVTLAIPSIAPDYVDITNFDSTGGFREYLVGLRDVSEITATLRYTTGMYTLADGYSTNDTLVYFRTTLPTQSGQTSGDVFTFQAFVTPSIAGASVGESLDMDLLLRVSGGLTFAAGATA